MGLSILLPVYQRSVHPLVEELTQSCNQIPIGDYEIICLDDFSDKEFKIGNKENIDIDDRIFYYENESNLGRSVTRNKLAALARYETLLYLDCDSRLLDLSFISNYIHAKAQYPDRVIYGGTSYGNEPTKSYYLHWLTGIKSEALNEDERNKDEYLSFHSNNFLCDREIILKIPFDPQLIAYGHEDTLWANQLKKANIRIQHIPNPVKHDGLENTEIFLSKTRESVKQLVMLNSVKKQFLGSKLETIGSRLKLLRMDKVYLWFFVCFESKINDRLLNKRPSIYLFKLYKLAWFIRFENREKMN